MLSYHANNITAGMEDMTYEDVMEYCEEMCGNGAWMTPGGCDDIQFQDLQDDAQCHRKSSHDFFLNVRIRFERCPRSRQSRFSAYFLWSARFRMLYTVNNIQSAMYQSTWVVDGH